MAISVADLEFPVIALSRDGTILIARERERLTTCSPHALRTYFDNLKIVALDGRRFTVKSARRISTKKRWWQRPILFLTLLKVELDFTEEGTAALDDVKKILLRAFKTDPYNWKEPLSYREFADQVNNCGSFHELAEYIRKGEEVRCWPDQ
jgi:hypothetical protein